jgi:hypothetical protein
MAMARRGQGQSIEVRSNRLKRPMKTHRALLFIPVASGLFFVSLNLAKAQLTPQEIQERQQKQDDELKNNPFNFYGRVVDENGQSVADAKATILVQGELGSTQGSTEYDVQTDGDGLFKLENSHSFGVIVTVAKNGYYTLPDEHNGPWYWLFGDGKRDSMPTKQQPAIFHLKKKGLTEPLIVMKTGAAKVLSDGTPLQFNFEKGHVVKGQPGTFLVQTWVDPHDPKSNQPYHWKFRITVPGGGLQPQTDEYQFIAPTSGYQASDKVDVAPGTPMWSDVKERDYFVKLADGKFAQVRVNVNAHGSFGIAQGLINPAGSPNLEFDSAKRLKPNP